MEPISIQIKKARVKQGLTQSGLAELISSHKANISQIESGKVNPTAKTLELICKALNCKLVIIDL